MVNREANIDLLFRNGLKDYEVLPPVGVWNDILPVIRKKQRPFILLRSAALVTVLLSMSFLVYRWGQEISNSKQNTFITLGEESVNIPKNSFRATGKRNFTSVKPVTKKSQESYVAFQQPSEAEILPAEKIINEPENKDVSDGEQKLTFNPEFLIRPGIQGFSNPGQFTSNSRMLYPDPEDSGLDIPKENVDRWSITAMASPTVYMHPEMISDDLSDQINSSEQSRVSYSGGVGFAYKLSKKFSIQSGLYYLSIGNEINGINSFAGFRDYDFTKGDHNFEVITTSGRIYTSNADVFLRDNSGGDRVLTMYTNDVFDPLKANLTYISSTLVQNFSYLEMPVIIRYKLIDRTIDFNLIGGISYNFLLNNSVNAIVDGSRYVVGKTEGLNPLMVSSSLGMGMEYNLSSRFSLNLEPMFKYYLNPFTELPGMKTHPYSFGIFSGLTFKF